MRPQVLGDAVFRERNFRLGGLFSAAKRIALEGVGASKCRRLPKPAACLGRVLVSAVVAKAAAALQVVLAHHHGGWRKAGRLFPHTMTSLAGKTALM